MSCELLPITLILRLELIGLAGDGRLSILLVPGDTMRRSDRISNGAGRISSL